MANPSTSAIFQWAAQLRSRCVADYAVLQEHEYQQAEHATNGAMLNRRGWASGHSCRSVMYGPPTMLRAYASQELLDHLAINPRTTRTEFERQWLEDYLGGVS